MTKILVLRVYYILVREQTLNKIIKYINGSQVVISTQKKIFSGKEIDIFERVAGKDFSERTTEVNV